MHDHNLIFISILINFSFLVRSMSKYQEILKKKIIIKNNSFYILLNGIVKKLVDFKFNGSMLTY